VPDDPAPARPVRPITVLDANVLIPAGLRDLMLSCADVGVFRPVWQAEIEFGGTPCAAASALRRVLR